MSTSVKRQESTRVMFSIDETDPIILDTNDASSGVFELEVNSTYVTVRGLWDLTYAIQDYLRDRGLEIK